MNGGQQIGVKYIPQKAVDNKGMSKSPLNLCCVLFCSKVNIIRTEKCSLDWTIRGSLIINWIIIIVLMEHLVQKHRAGMEVRKEGRKYRPLLEGKGRRHTVFDNN